MPYKISAEGLRVVASEEGLDELTELQVKALKYLKTTSKDRFVDAREVAVYYGYPNGQYFRGVLASLHQKGLLIKPRGEE